MSCCFFRVALTMIIRRRKEIKIDNFGEHYNRYITRQITKSALARELKISRPTLDKLIAEYQAAQ